MDKFLFLFVIALCGTRASSLKAEGANRMLEGTPANGNQYLYIVSLQNRNEAQTYTRGHRCGGALVTFQHAVTAASCTFFEVNGVFMPINPAEFRVFSGAYMLTDVSIHHSRSIERITPHPEYSTSTPFVNNIAVIFLYTAFIPITSTPVPLPITDAGVTDITPCYVSGWGAQNATATASVQMMQIPQRVPDQGVCRAHYDGQLNVVDSMICSWGVQQTPFSGCTGDLGNPLVCNGYLTGILIRHKNCMVSADPEVYTRISSFRAWIHSTTTPNATTPNAASTFQPGIAVLAVIAIAQIITASVIN